MYITEIKPSDYDKIVEIAEDIFEYSPFRTDRKVVEIIGENNVHKISLGILENATSTFIAVSGNKILGFLSWKFDKNLTSITAKRYYRIQLFGVDKEFQRKGIGSELLKYFLEFVKKQKGDIVETSTDVNNLPATNIYQKFGFLYTSSFITFRLFPGELRNFENEDIVITKVSNSNELDDFVKIRSKNDYYSNYPIQCLFDGRIENRTKQIILQNYHKAIETNFNSFRMYVSYYKNLPIGYGAIKEDFSLSSLLSRISNKFISVYRIFDIFVADEYRNRGIGSSLISKMISDIPKPYDFIEVVIPSHNYSASNTLIKVGFKISHSMINFTF